MSILAAVDGEERPDRVVTVADDLAEAYDDELVVLNVIPQEEFDERWRQEDYNAEDAQEEAIDVAESVVEATLGDDADYTPNGRVGDVTEEILSEAAQQDAQYVVIGGRKRTPVGKALFGSVTQSVLLEADRPVVAVMSSE